MREEEAAWRAAADRLHRQQEEYLQLLEREATRSTDDLIEEYTLPERKLRDTLYANTAEAQREVQVASATFTAQSRAREQELERQLEKQSAAQHALGEKVTELQRSLQDSRDLSAAASQRHAIELGLLAADLAETEEPAVAAGPNPSLGVGLRVPSVGEGTSATQLSVEALRKRAEASETEAARLHAALQQQARLENAEKEVRRLRGEAELLEGHAAAERLRSVCSDPDASPDASLGPNPLGPGTRLVRARSPTLRRPAPPPRPRPPSPAQDPRPRLARPPHPRTCAPPPPCCRSSPAASDATPNSPAAPPPLGRRAASA